MNDNIKAIAAATGWTVRVHGSDQKTRHAIAVWVLLKNGSIVPAIRSTEDKGSLKTLTEWIEIHPPKAR
jgi:hypothetical protein